MPHITHSMFLPCQSPASEINIFYFVMSLYLPNIFLVILGFFKILASLPHLLLSATLSLGPEDPGSGPGSVPVDINVIYVSISWPSFSHSFINKRYPAPGSVQSTRNIMQNKSNMVPVLMDLRVYKNKG